MRYTEPERFAARNLGGHDTAPFLLGQIVREPAQGPNHLKRLGPIPTEPVQEVKPERPEKIRDRRQTEPREGPVQNTCRLRQSPLHARRASHLEGKHVFTVPDAEDCPGGRWPREELGRAGPRVWPVSAVGYGEECSEGELVVEYGVNVAREKLGGGETRTVERFGVVLVEPNDGDFGRGCDTVCENGVHEDGRGAELGVAAFVGEELNGRNVVVFRCDVRVLRTVVPEPFLHRSN